ncbi:molybdopterin-dependent oxidoreductase [Robiginitalea sp. M366]|uniref:xanthine dehydrogenase family protein molybdopterin-binding subunit n=1 Tax=Robiginitalea aestuariiviva TaxID=3036903 RepID=UPI00240E9A0F|nr:molybdopterin cofactor-binding domain-containing protein [Robiginitalea aestuariiviva]MDG1570852.1 molybdopterin-dependent oxidoreductase [Robiginitalea aestuariiviva]
MAHKGKLSRRKFLIRTGLGTAGVLALGTYLARNPIRRSVLQTLSTMDLTYVGDTDDPLIWFELTADNHVLLLSPKVEMGQGIFTGMAQLAAEELEIPLERLRVVHAATATGNIDGLSTGGSTSIAGLWEPLRELAATFREMLRTEAARKLGAPLSGVQLKNGVFQYGDSQLTFADTAAGVTDWNLPETPALKAADAFRHIGKPVARVDLAPKVYGDPIFGLDAEMPGMLYGAVLRPTHIGARLLKADTQKAAGMPGVVQVVEAEDFVGVVARSYAQAERAKAQIEAEWEAPVHLQQADIEARMTVGNGKHTIIQKEGGPMEGPEGETLEFRTPIGAHAQLEPNGALAHVEEGRATVVISTQVVGLTRKEVAERLGMNPEQVNIIPAYLGGGFGRRLHTPHAVPAAVMSKAVGRPVKYIFSRQEEFQHDMFRPPTHHRMKGRLGADGRLEHLEHHFVSGDVGNNSALMIPGVPTILGADIGAVRGGLLQYTGVPNLRAVYYHVDLPFATSWWRSLGLLANTFAIESFVDHMAAKAGQDALTFRLQHIPQDDALGARLRAVLERAAKASAYTETVRAGRAMGLAASVDAGTPCAQVVELSLEEGKIRIHKVTCVLDPGLAVNPDQVRAQCEGSIHMGLSAALYEEMQVVDGALTPVIYGPYRMLLMKDAPREIEVILLQGKETPGPVGEPPLGPIGAAVANALFRLTGKRPVRMPLAKSI